MYYITQSGRWKLRFISQIIVDEPLKAPSRRTNSPLMLPIISIIYFDTLAVQKESKAQIDRMERLRKQLEEDRKKMGHDNRKEE